MKKLSLMLLALMTAGFALAGNYDGVMPEAVPSGVNGQTVAASVNAPSEPLRTAETPVPTITIENYGYYVVVSVDGEGQLTGQILINGDVYEEFSAAEHYECTIESVFDILQEIWVYASAQLLGADPSPTVSHSCYLDPIPKPVMPTPEISYTENDSSLCIVIDGNGILCGSIVIDGDIVMQFEEYEHFEYTVEKLYDVSQIVEVIVRAQADGYDPSEEVHEYYLIEPMPRPIAESPEISADLSGTVLIITIVSDGEVSGKIEINGYEVTQFCAIGPFQYSVEMTGETQDIYIEAWADKPGYQTSEVVTYTYELPPLPDAPWPIADLHLTDSQGIVMVTGEGYMTMLINGEEVLSGEGYLEYAIPRGEDDFEIVVTVRVDMPGYLPIEVNYCFVIPAKELYYMPEPAIAYDIQEDRVNIHVMGEGHLSLYINGGFIAESSEGYIGYTVLRSDVDQELYLVAVSSGGPDTVSGYASKIVYVPALERCYDFMEDGIYYKITGQDKVSVTYESNAYNSYSGQVTIPATVTHDGVTYKVTAIYDRAFLDCQDLTEVTIGSNVSDIGNYSFSNCTSLTSLTLGNYVISIGSYAFQGCTSLASVNMGCGMRNIGRYAFSGCDALTSVICKAAVPPVMASSDCFDCYASATLTVHPSAIERYQDADNWKEFAAIVEEVAIDPAPGDVNGDNSINISDVIDLINAVLNTI